MKAISCGALILLGCALPLSPALAFSNSPQGAVILGGGEAPLFGGRTDDSQPTQAHFLSGRQHPYAPVHHKRVYVRHHIVRDR